MSTGFYVAALSQVVSPSTGSPVAPVWRRWVAYIADSVLLGFVGAGIGHVFSERLSQLGPWGPLVGFFVGALYFVPLDCKIGNGQSLGKRLLKIRVADLSGAPISFWRALVRYTVFSLPSTAYDLKLPIAKQPWTVSALIFVLVLWVGGSTLYLIVFEKSNRQGLHDLSCGSYVVYSDNEDPIEAKPVLQGHWLILGSLLLAITVCAAMLNDWSEKQPVQVEFRRDTRLIESMGGVRRVNIKETLTHSQGASVQKVIYINVARETKPVSEQAFASEVAKTLLRSDQSLQSYDLIDVRLFYGYDIGIASHSEQREFNQSPAAWSNP